MIGRTERAIASKTSRKASGVLDAAAFPTRGRFSPERTRFPHHDTRACDCWSGVDPQRRLGNSVP